MKETEPASLYKNALQALGYLKMPARKLLGWGTTKERSKSPDDRISSIMPKLKQVEAERLAAAKK